MVKLTDRCFCCFTAAMLVPLGRTPTWRFHTKLYKFGWSTLPNNAPMKNRTELNLGKVFYVWLIYQWFWYLFLIAWYCKPAIDNYMDPWRCMLEWSVPYWGWNRWKTLELTDECKWLRYFHWDIPFQNFGFCFQYVLFISVICLSAKIFSIYNVNSKIQFRILG